MLPTHGCREADREVDIKSVEKFGHRDLVDQFHNDAFAAYNAATNGLTPELLLFVTRLSCASLPNLNLIRSSTDHGLGLHAEHSHCPEWHELCSLHYQAQPPLF